MTDPSLLLVTLGPVQGFIAAGRRTADLWAGSEMLSHLAGHAVEAVEAEVGPDAFLFPARTASGTAASADPDGAAALPNRFLVRVPTARAESLAAAAERAVRDELRAIARYALGRVGLEASHAAEAEAVARFAEVAWVALPEDADADGLLTDWGDTTAYGRRYRLVEMLSGARKALRDGPAAGAPTAPESGHRCTLIPTLPALVPTPDAPPAQVRAFWAGSDRPGATTPPSASVSGRSRGRIRPEERLSAVALAKRFFPDYRPTLSDADDETEAFPSTSSFAASDLVRAVLRSDDGPVRSAAEAYGAAVRGLPRRVAARYTEAAVPALAEAARGSALGQLHRRSGRLLLGDDLTSETAQKETGHAVDAAALDALARARRALLDAAEAAGIDAPSRYYGVLVLDGDKMGEWLAGGLGADAFRDDAGDPLRGARRHQAISHRLQRFAREVVPRIVQGDHVGRLVYSGGDDVVALLSFATALDAARALREAFARDDVLPGATASAGLVFAHHLTPLQQVLAAARAAETLAKDAGRDRIAVTALKRSGAPATLTLGWADLPPAVRFADLIRERAVATGLLHDLVDVVRRLGGPAPASPTAAPPDLPDPLVPAFAAEARRLFGRRAEALPDDDARAAAFDASIGALLERVRPRRLVQTLTVAQFIGQGGDR